MNRTPRSLPAGALRFTDTEIPLEQREEEVRLLGLKGGPESVRILKELGGAGVYLSGAAIAALGEIRTPETERYLRGIVADTGSMKVRELAAAAKSLAAVAGDSAVPDLAKLLESARTRNDGLQGDIAAAVVDALGDIGGPKAAAVLSDELRAFGAARRLDHEYASAVVQALARAGDAASAPALLDYAGMLEKEMAAGPDGFADYPGAGGVSKDTRERGEKMIRRVYEDKIAEARRVAAELLEGGRKTNRGES